MRFASPFLAAAASAALLAGSAGAAIVPQKGIAGVSIGMSQAKVRSVLGKPIDVKRGTNDFGAYALFYYGKLTLTFQGNTTLTQVTTTRPSEKTARGVGVGSTEADVKAMVRGVKCEAEFGFRHCFLGAFTPGRRVTDFVIKRGHVTRVSVGAVVD